MVILIPKPGKNPKLVGNLRLISFLPHVSKVFERIPERRLCDHIRNRDILIPKQFGFREGHSSIHQLMWLAEFVTRAKCDGKQTLACFLDVEQAFDSDCYSNEEHSPTALLTFTYRKPNVHILAGFLRKRTSRVRIDNVLSQERTITAGSILGPFLSCERRGETARGSAFRVR